MEVKKWNHDSSTNVLEIHLSQKCTQGQAYKMNLFVSYKNYGSFLYDKTLYQQTQA